ncbi:DUF3828 domain-containing protein [Bradyrhizobium sp. AUGA SZCCT0283]|uniref:DUF3828 domain-containing protein n=1 Tax=Bradyrhizobium sp. AUGA SZCCT0283 TaxID=2807671 RepID=UPI001BAE4E4D|nr:DUF3828 domain-containing protein [Bradyrhizobium sp. AUGA SZCCT0283]MBR1278819.1 DUF3828 domain-containing protein [Bradyrhizobium sp. AUGA SZCCT0283]
MVTRRKLILSGAAGLLAATLPRASLAAPDDPVGIVTAIYTRAAKGKGDGGGVFVFENKAAKAKHLSKSLIALWAKADARTRKGDGGPVDFDPVTNSQDPDVKSFKVVAEKQEADKAVIAVTIDSQQGPPPKPADRTIRYDFVPEAGGWKIDEIKGAVDGKAWSLRAMLTDFLKY